MTRAAPALIALLLVAAALVTPFNHDEAQYYAAARLAQTGLPYRDFVVLQTPLFGWWGALIGMVAGDWLLVAGRVSQALLGLAVVVVLWRGALRLTRDQAAARVAAFVVLASYPFLFSATVFRNDILPLLFASGAIVLLALHAREPAAAPLRRLATAGLLIGLAASTKANFGLIGMAPAVWVAAQSNSWAVRFAHLGALAAGALLGMAPAFLAILAAPEAAWWQIVTFASEAPHAWYLATGQGERLTPAGRTLDALIILLQGPLLIVLAVAARARLLRLSDDKACAVLDGLALAALVAALIPVPSWRQYFVVLIPPLALRAALWWQASQAPARTLAGRLMLISGAIGIVSGLVRSGSGFVRWNETIIAREGAAHRLDALLSGRSAEGRIVTLAPEYVIDSGLALDPAFAAGPFVYRWDQAMQGAPPAMQIVTRETLAAHLRAHPPLALVTGAESDAHDARRDLDAALREWAQSHAYRPVPLEDGVATAYIAPLLAPQGVAKRWR